jgi:hypothetical protein
VCADLTAHSLIHEVYGTAAAPDEQAEERFFNRLRLPNGVYKTTAGHRLDDVNRLVADLLPDDRPLCLMDVAVSSGVTALDWSEQLTAAGVAHTMLAGDNYTEGVWLSFGWADVVLDRDRTHLLYADILGRGVETSSESRRSMLVTGVLAVLARYRLLRPRVRRIPLVSPRLQSHSAVTVVEDDIFARRAALAGRFHAVRAANILNRVYFDDVRLTRAVANLRERLRADGLLIVCRTHPDGTNHGTVFRAGTVGFDVVARIGDGSEIEGLVVG